MKARLARLWNNTKDFTRIKVGRQLRREDYQRIITDSSRQPIVRVQELSNTYAERETLGRVHASSTPLQFGLSPRFGILEGLTDDIIHIKEELALDPKFRNIQSARVLKKVVNVYNPAGLLKLKATITEGTPEPKIKIYDPAGRLIGRKKQ